MYGAELPVDRRPVRPVLGSVAPVPPAADTCRVTPPPGSSGGPGTAPWDDPGSQDSLLYSACTSALQDHSSSDYRPAGPETPGSGGPAGRDQTVPREISPGGKTKYGQRNSYMIRQVREIIL